MWVEAARPRTLGAGIVPVVVGTAAAERFVAWRFVAALVVAVALQVGVNFGNDYSDGVRGIDGPARVGPRRAVASGLVSARAMMLASSAALALAGGIGTVLAVVVEPWLFAIGAASLLAALGYSGGPRPYGAAGLGEVFVFVFFGVVATAGSAYVQDERLVAVALAASVPVGLFAAALLVANNVRDVDGDALAGKTTLAVRLGRQRTKRLYGGMLAAGFAAIVGVAALDLSAAPLIALGALPLRASARSAIAAAGDARSAVPVLGATARLHAVAGLLLAVGLWIS